MYRVTALMQKLASNGAKAEAARTGGRLTVVPKP